VARILGLGGAGPGASPAVGAGVVQPVLLGVVRVAEGAAGPRPAHSPVGVGPAIPMHLPGR
jgi:hypothetical protein